IAAVEEAHDTTTMGLDNLVGILTMFEMNLSIQQQHKADNIALATALSNVSKVPKEIEEISKEIDTSNLETEDVALLTKKLHLS
ncbi:hypothetical protein, partial [Salmonella sp. M205]|uniref:hypothetical protein n=1 Tax=Salmonella sp. M205 TaxID=3240294 RepID=UPI003529D43E